MPDTPPSKTPEGAMGTSTGSSPAGTPPGASPGNSTDPAGDWTVTVTERIVGLVTTLRDRTTVPVQKIARAVVFGLVITVMAVVALVLVVIGVLRLHVYLPFHPVARRVWVTYVGLGAIFMVAGAFLWRKRTIRTKE